MVHREHCTVVIHENTMSTSGCFEWAGGAERIGIGSRHSLWLNRRRRGKRVGMKNSAPDVLSLVSEGWALTRNSTRRNIVVCTNSESICWSFRVFFLFFHLYVHG